MSDKFVVAKSFYGLGGNIAVLSCAWIAAINLNRKLIIDWRGGHYGTEQNYFSQLFQKLSIQADLRDIETESPEVFPEYWQPYYSEIPQYRKNIPLTLASSDLIFGPDTSFDNEKHDVVIVSRDGAYFHKSEHTAVAKAFFHELRPIEEIQQKISLFKKTKFTDHVIGVHFRHGNGEPSVVPPRFEWFRDSVQSLIAKLDPASVRIFVATDCKAALDRFCNVFGDKVISYPKVYPPLGEGGMHYKQDAESKLLSAVEALTDMQLLSQCDGFVGSKSFFSVCANHWSKGFTRTNSRWYTPHLRAFKPTALQSPASKFPDLVAHFGDGYPLDNIYIDVSSGSICFQDIEVGVIDLSATSLSQIDAIRENILRYRLY